MSAPLGRGEAGGGRGVAATAIAALIGACAYGWWLVGLEPFAWPSTVAVSVPAVVVIVAGARHSGSTVTVTVRAWLGDLVGTVPRAVADERTVHRTQARVALLWALSLAALATVQLFALFVGGNEAREAYPTLSWIVDQVESRAGRTALFVVWLAFGIWLVRR